MTNSINNITLDARRSVYVDRININYRDGGEDAAAHTSEERGFVARVVPGTLQRPPLASKRSHRNAGNPDDFVTRAKMTAEALRARGRFAYGYDFSPTTTMEQAYAAASKRNEEELRQRIEMVAAANKTRAGLRSGSDAPFALGVDAFIPDPEVDTTQQTETAHLQAILQDIDAYDKFIVSIETILESSSRYIPALSEYEPEAASIRVVHPKFGKISERSAIHIFVFAEMLKIFSRDCIYDVACTRKYIAACIQLIARVKDRKRVLLRGDEYETASGNGVDVAFIRLVIRFLEPEILRDLSRLTADNSVRTTPGGLSLNQIIRGLAAEDEAIRYGRREHEWPLRDDLISYMVDAYKHLVLARSGLPRAYGDMSRGSQPGSAIRSFGSQRLVRPRDLIAKFLIPR